MGLDISFNRTAAIAAGIKLSVLRNGSDSDIAIEEANPDKDPEYIQWLKAESECMEVPGLGTFVTNDGIGDNITIRANKWGRVYAPMTNWLKANNITWGEY